MSYLAWPRLVISRAGRCPEFLHSNAGFDRCARTGVALYRWRDPVEEALNLRGSLRGRRVPGDADLTCDTIGGLECGRLADLRDLAADCLDLHTNRGL